MAFSGIFIWNGSGTLFNSIGGDMKITIEIEDEGGNLLQRSRNGTIDGAVQELYRFERHNAETV